MFPLGQSLGVICPRICSAPKTQSPQGPFWNEASLGKDGDSIARAHGLFLVLIGFTLQPRIWNGTLRGSLQEEDCLGWNGWFLEEDGCRVSGRFSVASPVDSWFPLVKFLLVGN